MSIGFFGRVFGAAACCYAAATNAHHSTAMYDVERTMQVRGQVVSYEWTNPHVYIRVRPEEPDGAQAWTIETGSPTMVERIGLFRDSLRPGDRVVVDAYPSRSATRRMALFVSVRKEDGSLAVGREQSARSGAPTPVPAMNLSGNWLPATPEFVKFIGPPSEWPLTAKGREAVAAFTDAESEAPQCVSIAAPFLMAWTELKQIEVGDDTTIIRAALIDAVERVVHMNATSHDGAEPANQGHSIGRWEAGVLVVDTAHFAPHTSGTRAGVPSGAQKHLIERFALNADKTRLTYSYELTDPEYLTQAVTGNVQWAHRPDLAYTGYECDVENARRFLEE